MGKTASHYPDELQITFRQVGDPEPIRRDVRERHQRLMLCLLFMPMVCASVNQVKGIPLGAKLHSSIEDTSSDLSNLLAATHLSNTQSMYR
jgi:hypothetical protein